MNLQSTSEPLDPDNLFETKFAMRVTPQTPTTIVNGNRNVTTAGTRVTLTASSTIVKSGVTIKAKAGNSGVIYVGNSTVTSSNGYALAAGETVFVEVKDLQTVYLNSSINGEGVTYIAT